MQQESNVKHRREEMSDGEWVRELPGAITVCDREGVILEMNERAAEGHADDGGRALIGRNALDCHPELARSKMRELLKSHKSNVYTIEKCGVRKLVYQAPWFKNGVFAGLVELVLDLPQDLPHFVRQG